jgi:agmatine deiminase
MAPGRPPAADGFRMPAEHAPHERTLMAWPCRAELWGAEIERARAEYAAVANAVAAFEPVTMVCGSAQDAAAARAALTAAAEVVELPIDDSWLRDSGPIFVLGQGGARAAVHFGFNAWGEKFHPYDRDAAIGGVLGARAGDEVYRAPFVLEGGSVTTDGLGTLVTTEQCLLHPNRNPEMTREQLEEGLQDFLGTDRVVWLGRGLVEDRDTDGHVDLIAAFAADGRLLLQSRPPGDPDHEAMADNHERAAAAGLDVIAFEPLARGAVAGQDVVHSYLNLYLANGAVVVPTAGDEQDAGALEAIGSAYPEREVVGVPGLTIAFGGGGPHCITQQVPLATPGSI